MAPGRWSQFSIVVAVMGLIANINPCFRPGFHQGFQIADCPGLRRQLFWRRFL